MTERVLVTGGAGFLGANLVARLLAEGHEVLCLDNGLTGDWSRLDAVPKPQNLQRLDRDVCDNLDEAVSRIYHLACPASPRYYLQHPLETGRIAVAGTLNMLELARRNGARILFTSSSEVYGDPLQHPQTEDYAGNVNCDNERSCYVEGKRYGESLCADYQRVHGADVRVARIFNTYGPGMGVKDGRIVSSFVVNALRGEAIPVHGNGLQTRSFCYIDDMISGLVALMNHRQPLVSAVNLGNPEEQTVLQCATLVKRFCDSDSAVIHQPDRQGDPRRRCPDIRRARTLLDWSPRTNFREGLQKTCAWYRERL